MTAPTQETIPTQEDEIEQPQAKYSGGFKQADSKAASMYGQTMQKTMGRSFRIADGEAKGKLKIKKIQDRSPPGAPKGSTETVTEKLLT